MKLRIFLFSFFCIFINIVSNVHCKQKDWYIFEPTKAIYKLFNETKKLYLLDPPAGKHGFVIIKNGHFYFEDGTPVKFWGVNLVFGACFPNHHEAELIAKKLAAMGVNLVRLHSMDRWLEPNGIWDKKDSKKISYTQLDKLDYFIYCLKKEGIYIDLNLLVTRDFSKISKKFSGLALGGKPACLFDPYLIKFQKEYAKKLLLHLNPYTKTTYNNEPAIAFIEIVNECSIFHYWFMGILDGRYKNRIFLSYYFRNQLDKLWNTWLKNKYKKVSEIPWYKSFNYKNQNFFNFKRPPYKYRFYFPKEEIEDLIQFYYDLEKKYFEDMKTYLKRTLKVKSLILTTNVQHCLLDLMLQQSIGDYIDFHFAWDHPTFPSGRWSLINFNFTNKDPLQEGEKNWIKRFSKALVVGKPLIISEWSANNFNKYAYTVPLLFTVYGSILNIDGLVAFNYWNKRFNYHCKYICDVFSFKNNPQKIALFIPCGIIFLNHLIKTQVFFKIKHYSFKSAIEYVYKYSRKMPICFKHTKNSFFFQKYCFGNFSTLLKQQDNNLLVKKSNYIFWDSKNRIFKIDGDYVQAVTGRLSFFKSKILVLKYLKLKSKTNGTIILISLDKKPINKSKKLLLCVVGEVKNSYSSWMPKKFILGNSPVLLKIMKTQLKFEFMKKFYLLPIYSNQKDKKYLYHFYDWINLHNFNTPWFIIERLK